jgi:hypothetical protein
MSLGSLSTLFSLKKYNKNIIIDVSGFIFNENSLKVGNVNYMDVYGSNFFYSDSSDNNLYKLDFYDDSYQVTQYTTDIYGGGYGAIKDITVTNNNVFISGSFGFTSNPDINSICYININTKTINDVFITSCTFRYINSLIYNNSNNIIFVNSVNIYTITPTDNWYKNQIINFNYANQYSTFMFSEDNNYTIINTIKNFNTIPYSLINNSKACIDINNKYIFNVTVIQADFGFDSIAYFDISNNKYSSFINFNKNYYSTVFQKYYGYTYNLINNARNMAISNNYLYMCYTPYNANVNLIKSTDGNNTNCNNILRIDIITKVIYSLGSGLNGTVNSMVFDKNKNRLYVVGDFTNAGGTVVKYSAFWDEINNIWYPICYFNSPPLNITFSSDNNILFISGPFTIANGRKCNGFCAMQTVSL